MWGRVVVSANLLAADEAQLDGDAQVVLFAVQFARVGFPDFTKGGFRRFGDHAVAGQLVLDPYLGLHVLEFVGKELVRNRDPPHRERLPQQQTHLLLRKQAWASAHACVQCD